MQINERKNNPNNNNLTKMDNAPLGISSFRSLPKNIDVANSKLQQKKNIANSRGR